MSDLQLSSTADAPKLAVLVARFHHALDRNQRIAECVIRAAETNPKLRRRLAAALKDAAA